MKQKTIITLTLVLCALAIAYALTACAPDPVFTTDRLGVHHTHPNGLECRYTGRLGERNVFTYCVEVE